MHKKEDSWIKVRREESKKSYHIGIPTNELRIVLVGKTGNGKSATGNTLLNWEGFVSDFSANPVTKVCKKRVLNEPDKKIVVVDTPGLSSKKFSSDEIKSEIARCIGITAPGPHVFLIVLRLGRQTCEDQKAIHDIQEIFGEGIFKYGILLFTRKNHLVNRNTSLESFLETFPESFKQELEKYQNGYIAIDNCSEDRANERKMLLDKIQTMVKSNEESYYSNENTQKAEDIFIKNIWEIIEKDNMIRKMKNQSQSQHNNQPNETDDTRKTSTEDSEIHKKVEDNDESKQNQQKDITLKDYLLLTDEEKLGFKGDSEALVTPENIRFHLRKDCEDGGVTHTEIESEVNCSIM